MHRTEKWLPDGLDVVGYQKMDFQKFKFGYPFGTS